MSTDNIISINSKQTIANSLVTTNADGELTTTSLIIAEGVGNDHASVMKLIRNNIVDFHEFGRVGFEIRPFMTAGGEQKREIAIINEQQATLLLTYLRNSDVVRKFKKTLIKEFFRMRDSIKKSFELPDFNNPVEAARAWADERERSMLLEAKVQEDAPKVEFAEIVGNVDDLYSIKQVADLLTDDSGKGVGRNVLFKMLRDKKILCSTGTSKNQPYRKYIDSGDFHVKLVPVELDEVVVTKATTYATAKGLQRICKWLGLKLKTEQDD